MDGKISNLCQVASLRRYVLCDGAERGLEVIDCNNGTLRFLINVSKACDIMQLYHRGENVSFVTKNGFTGREIPFLNRFEGGMVYTCGLDSVGGREGYELHGTLHNTPAKIVRAQCDEQGICVEAEIRDTALFGKNFVLKRRISSERGSEHLTIEDTLVNEGYAEEPYCLLYHVNVGYPMLDEGTKIVANARQITPRTEWAKENIATVYEMQNAQAEREETCYFLELAEPTVSVLNEKTGKAFTLAYSARTLPHFVEWKSEASCDYALGLEPCTTELDERFAYKTLQPREEVNFKLELSVKNLNE